MSAAARERSRRMWRDPALRERMLRGTARGMAVVIVTRSGHRRYATDTRPIRARRPAPGTLAARLHYTP